MRFAISTVMIIAGLVVSPFVVDSRYFTHIGVLIGITMTLALSLNLMLRLGQLSIVHAALMGVGAYTSALVTLRLGFPFWLAFLSSGLVVAAVAGVFGPLFLRIKGVYFVLLTFALGQMIILLFQEWVGLFGGNNGLFGIPHASLFGNEFSGVRDYYLFALALAALSFIFVQLLYKSEIGTMIDSLEEDETLSRSLGVDALQYRIAIFCVSGFLAGLSGSLYAHYLTFLSPEAFSFWTVVDVIVINVIGGISSPLGPVLGSMLLVPLPELLRDAQEYQVLVYGVLLVAFLLFMPEGLVGAIRAIGTRFKR